LPELAFGKLQWWYVQEVAVATVDAIISQSLVELTELPTRMTVGGFPAGLGILPTTLFAADMYTGPEELSETLHTKSNAAGNKHRSMIWW